MKVKMDDVKEGDLVDLGGLDCTVTGFGTSYGSAGTKRIIYVVDR